MGCVIVIGRINGCNGGGGVVLCGRYGDVFVVGIVIDIGLFIGVFWEDGWIGIGLFNTLILSLYKNLLFLVVRIFI